MVLMPIIRPGASKDSGVQANKWVHITMTKWDKEVMTKCDNRTHSSARTGRFTQKDIRQTYV
jgi:hypothetical protein